MFQSQEKKGEYHSPLLPAQLLIGDGEPLVDNLDGLNSQLGLASMEYDASVGTVLRFRGRLNPARLAELYRAVPSVVKAKTVTPPGDASKVYPWLRVQGE